MKTLHLSIIAIFVLGTSIAFAQTNESIPWPVTKWLVAHSNFTGCVQTNMKTGEQKQVSCFHPELRPFAPMLMPELSSYVNSPLGQFKSGIPISNIQCAQNLSLVIKAEDKTPACINQDNISKLILRGWLSTTSSFGQNNTIFGDFYPGIENDSGIVSIKNQIYYMMTASNTTYPIAHGMTVTFHQVTFSFPYGSQATPGGVIIPFDMTFSDGTTEAYGNVTKNPDGSGSMSGISLGPGPSSNRTVTVQSDHMHPQAGLTLTEDQIKLLVSTDGNSTIVH